MEQTANAQVSTLARFPARVELSFQPSIELIYVARRFVSDFYDRILGDPDATSRLALATHELLENAVKYATDGTATLAIEVTEEGGKCVVKIQTSNRAEPNHVETLRATFEEMKATPDAFAFYQMLMHRNAKRRGGSGLGLARIRAEGEMTMSWALTPQGVSIFAETHVGAPGAS